jgi:MFS superfamily sulfate permease-like transporter
VAHPQTYGERNKNALTSFLFRNNAATFGAKDTDSSSYSIASRKQQIIALDTSSFFLFRNAATFAAKVEEEEKKSSRHQRQLHRQRESKEQQRN